MAKAAPQRPAQATIKTPDELAVMREAGRIVARAHAAMALALRPGISTAALNDIAAQVLRDHGATPAFLGYPKVGAPDFPACITASINHELVHGVPSPHRVLRDGDIISLDVGCHYQGFVGDAAMTHAVGEVPAAVQRLLAVCKQALAAAIAVSQVGRETRDIALAVQQLVADAGYSVAREYTGHGVGRVMHEPPELPNWWPSRKLKRTTPLFESVLLRPGMTLAIEPMVIAGRDALRELDDGWTVVTVDGSLCAHDEHTVAVTEDGPQVLTQL